MPEPAPAATHFEAIREQILQYVASCKQPVLREEGSEPLAISADNFHLQHEHDALQLEAWTDTRTVSRRILAMRPVARGIVLVSRKFGGREAEITITDTVLSGERLDRSLARKSFRERFRALLMRQFPGASIERLSNDRDLNRSFSEHYVRAVVKQGARTWAAIGVSHGEGGAAISGILTQGLLWLDHVKAGGLCIFIPASGADAIAHRIAWLRKDVAYMLVPLPESDGIAASTEPLAPLDIANRGNLRTELRAPRLMASLAPDALERLREIGTFPGVVEEITPRGELSLRYHGLEVAHADALGVAVSPHSLAEVARFRNPESSDRRHPLYTRSAERWMESILRHDLSPLSLDLAGSPVYSQILSEAGRARGIVDLLGIARTGRLVVIELKADEDPQLTLQALDYWIRIRWHLERGDFERCGFFPGREIAREAPLLWLVFPSIRLHPANEVARKYLSPEIEIARLGVNEDWRKGIRVVFRA